MALNNGACGFNNLLKSLTAVGNFEQNMFYPPFVFQAHVNTITSLLISELVKIFPKSPSALDMLNPFIKIAMIPATNGFIQLPSDYRDILGTPMIFANPDSTGECGGQIEPLTAQNFKTGILKAGCKLNAVTVVPQAEFGDLTTSTYNAPTYDQPIAYFSGSNQLRICPYDLTKVAVMYARQETPYIMGYIMNPDDTYFIDPTTTTDTEWTSAAYTPIFNALVALYSAWSRDNEIVNWSQVLKNGIL